MIYGKCSCPWGWESRAEEARLRAVSYFSFESRRSRARHSACEGRGTMAEARAKKKFPLSGPISPPFSINLHNFTFSLAARGRKEGRPLARGQEGGKNNLNPSHTGNRYPSQVRNQSRKWSLELDYHQVFLMKRDQ